MKITFLILSLLLSAEEPQPKNILDSYGQKPNARTEQRILKKFKESDCYTRGNNPKIQPHYNYTVQVHYELDLKNLNDSIFADESLFFEKFT